jgi:hypothetical protein
LSTRTIGRAAAELLAGRWITCERNVKGRTNYYRLADPRGRTPVSGVVGHECPTNQTKEADSSDSERLETRPVVVVRCVRARRLLRGISWTWRMRSGIPKRS